MWELLEERLGSDFLYFKLKKILLFGAKNCHTVIRLYKIESLPTERSFVFYLKLYKISN